MPKRNRPSAWAIAKAAAQMRKPYSKGGSGWGNKRARVVPGFTRTAGPYKRALLGRPGGRTLTLGGQIEKKYLDTGIGYATATTTGTVVSSLLAIPQGTTEVTRVGGKINVCNINMRGQVRGLTATGVPGAVRWMLILDKQCNGAAPAVTDILTSAAINSFLNMDNVDRFQVLKDKMIVNNFGAISPTPLWYLNTVLVKCNYKCNIPIHYSSTTGAIAEIKSNNLIWLIISERSSSVEYGLTARIKFTDA